MSRGKTCAGRRCWSTTSRAVPAASMPTSTPTNGWPGGQKLAGGARGKKIKELKKGRVNRALPGRIFPSTDAVAAPVELLLAHDITREKPPEHRRGRGRPADPTFAVHPGFLKQPP